MRFILLLLLFLPIFTIAQLEISVTIRTTDGNMLAGANTYISLNGQKVMSQVTDATGKVMYSVEEPGNYTFFYKEDIKGFDFEMKEGRRGQMSRTLTYDPEGVFSKPPKADRSGIAFNEINQRNVQFQPTTGKCGYQIVLKNLKGQPGTNVPVDMVDMTSKTKYRSRTDSRGMAKFFVPTGKTYEVDVDGIEAVDIIKVPAIKYGVFTSELPYEPPKISERMVGDSIYQSNINQTDGASTHAYCKIELINYNREGIEGEKVYLNDLNSQRVYVGTTNSDGVVEFMLKNGTHYVMHLTMERDVKLIKLDETRGFKTMGMTHMYRGTEAILDMLANRKRDDKGFIQKFEETPIEKITDPKVETKVLSNGLELTTEENGKVPPITIANGKMFFSEGFYSKNFYGYDPVRKSVIWGVKLGESGAGAAVYSDGVLLINTYSCTLYALEASTGKLLWSKYLANTLYSNPSVKDGQVLVVFDNEMELQNGKPFVLANFDLKTGKINWQKLLSDDAIACPVIADDEVHVASVDGKYEIFNLKTGDSKTMNSGKALSSPTITKDEIFLTIDENGKETFASYDRKSFTKKKSVPISDSLFAEAGSGQCFERMHFQGSRSVHYKGLNYMIYGSDLICVDAQSEKIMWKQNVGMNGDLRTVVAGGGRVWVQTDKDAILFFEAQTGKQVDAINTNCPLYAPATSQSGKLCYADDKGKIFIQQIRQTLNYPQWGISGEHNLVFEE
ncbi:MAG: PQQ-like beta-propeller repeat protein [Crocinitomicaceae bacterium]|nr:PQQ-like beta-propeller repeat protein [Crocinitomicaceae bacterium]